MRRSRSDVRPLQARPVVVWRGGASGSSAARARRCRARSIAGPCRRPEGEHAAVERSVQESAATCREGTRRTSTRTCGCAAANVSREGNSAWTAASFAPMTTRPRRTCCSSRTALFGVGRKAARSRARTPATARRPRSAHRCATTGRKAGRQICLRGADGLADGRLRPVELAGCGREAASLATVRNVRQVLQLHTAS